jgi:hypothetical protein
MKKVLLVVMSLVSFSAAAVDLQVMNGRDKVYGKDMLELSAGVSVLGLKLDGSVSTVRDKYTALGFSVGKSFDLGKGFAITPDVGVQQFNPTVGKSGWVSTAGVELSYDLTKQSALVVDFTRRFDMSDGGAFQGNQMTAGLRVSF